MPPESVVRAREKLVLEHFRDEVRQDADTRHRTRMTAYFVFDRNEKLVAERIYFDQLSILRQLIVRLNSADRRA